MVGNNLDGVGNDNDLPHACANTTDKLEVPQVSIEESSEARIVRLGRERPPALPSTWHAAAFIYSIVMSQFMTECFASDSPRSRWYSCCTPDGHHANGIVLPSRSPEKSGFCYSRHLERSRILWRNLLAGVVGQFMHWGLYFWIGAILTSTALLTSIFSIPRGPLRQNRTSKIKMDCIGAAFISSELIPTVLSITQLTLGIADIIQIATVESHGLAKSYKYTFCFGAGESAISVALVSIYGHAPRAENDLTADERAELIT